jgi:hypothetical protein
VLDAVLAGNVKRLAGDLDGSRLLGPTSFALFSGFVAPALAVDRPFRSWNNRNLEVVVCDG